MRCKKSFADQLVDANNHSADSASELTVRPFTAALRFDCHCTREPLLALPRRRKNQ